MASLRFTDLQSRPTEFLDRSYWIPGSWNVRMSYTEESPFAHP